jgi:hypothetical protein
MAGPTQPFPLPQKLPTALARLHRYWIDLRRGENAMPFSDDVNPENVPGVKAVHDHLVWIEPTSGFVMRSDEDQALAKAS